MSALDETLDAIRVPLDVSWETRKQAAEELAALRESQIGAAAQKSRADIHAETNDALRLALETVGVQVTHEVVAEAGKVKAEIDKLRRFDADHNDQVAAFNQGWGAPSWEAACDMGEDAEMGYTWRHFDRLRSALIRLRDCDWTISAGDRMDAVREIAREALGQ